MKKDLLISKFILKLSQSNAKVFFFKIEFIKHRLHTALCSHPQSKVSFSPHFPPFAHFHLPPPPFPSGCHHTVVCVCVSYIQSILLEYYRLFLQIGILLYSCNYMLRINKVALSHKNKIHAN